MTRKRLTQEEFVAKATETHGSLYDYTNTTYVNSRSKVNIMCTKCKSTFSQKATTHLQGSGCPHCNKHNKKLTNEDFIKSCIKVHGNLYDYSDTLLVNLRSKVKVYCNRCNSYFTQRAKNHKDGNGCPKCSLNGFKYDSSAILYYISINSGTAYKIGVTNNTVKTRFVHDSSSVDINVIATWEYSLGSEAYSAEQVLLNEYKEYKYFGEPLLVNGNTELFSKDVLGLDT